MFDKVVSLKADYIDLRVVNANILSITAKDGKIEKVESGTDYGIGVRILKNGNWGSTCFRT